MISAMMTLPPEPETPINDPPEKPISEDDLNYFRGPVRTGGYADEDEEEDEA